MRASLDFPDTLLRHLKARAAMEGTSLRELLSLIERGLGAASLIPGARPMALPSVRLGPPMALTPEKFSNAGLSELLDAFGVLSP